MRILALLLALFCAPVFALDLPTPATAELSPPLSCASQVNVPGSATQITGFSADGNYVLGQVASRFSCACRGRGCFHTYTVCTFLTWDLSGNLVSVHTPTHGEANALCPALSLNSPSYVPPSNSVVGNAFENSGGYTAETVVEEICGSIACYQTLYLPTLLAP